MSTQKLLNEELIYEALRDVYDPEIPVNIVDLGLVYGVDIAEADVKEKMTLTFAQQAEWRIAEIEEVDDVEVDIVFEPPWNPEMISEEGKKELGID